MTPPTPSPPPLIREGSRVFAAIAVTTLLIGGLAGMSGGTEQHDDAMPAAASSAAAAPGVGAADGHAHGDAAAAPGAAEMPHDDTGHHTAEHPAGAETAAAHTDGHGSAGSATAAPASAHDHPSGAPAAGAPAEAGHSDGHGDHDPAAPGGDDHAGHDPAAPGGDHGDGHDDGHHATSCADDHPVSKALVAEVQGELATTYKDIAALVALGYHPYFDSLVPGGYPPGGEGISHWINPNYINDGVVLDPQQPETILLDDWNWPIGMMFINDPGVPPKPVYANADGTTCSPWHPHTDYPARFGWYYYRAMYERQMEGEVPEQTPEMMHVWAIPNAKGVYAAHDYPKREVRKGAPGPMPSYFSDVDTG